MAGGNVCCPDKEFPEFPGICCEAAPAPAELVLAGIGCGALPALEGICCGMEPRPEEICCGPEAGLAGIGWGALS
ncbi:hypothetical protein VSQ48_19645 [Candidatus Ventrimonas sp. KK005]